MEFTERVSFDSPEDIEGRRHMIKMKIFILINRRNFPQKPAKRESPTKIKLKFETNKRYLQIAHAQRKRDLPFINNAQNTLKLTCVTKDDFGHSSLVIRLDQFSFAENMLGVSSGLICFVRRDCFLYWEIVFKYFSCFSRLLGLAADGRGFDFYSRHQMSLRTILCLLF